MFSDCNRHVGVTGVKRLAYVPQQLLISSHQQARSWVGVPWARTELLQPQAEHRDIVFDSRAGETTQVICGAGGEPTQTRM